MSIYSHVALASSPTKPSGRMWTKSPSSVDPSSTTRLNLLSFGWLFWIDVSVKTQTLDAFRTHRSKHSDDTRFDMTPFFMQNVNMSFCTYGMFGKCVCVVERGCINAAVSNALTVHWIPRLLQIQTKALRRLRVSQTQPLL